MADGFSSPIDIGLPGNPQGVSEELYDQFNSIYAAIRILQQKLGDLVGAGTLDISNYLSTIKPLAGDSVQVQRMQALIVTASEAIAAGDFCTLHNSSGLKVKRAQGNALATKAFGWAPIAIGNAAPGLIYLHSGLNQAVSGLTIGTIYYLSSSTPGGITSTRPVAAGTISQEVGVAISATELLVHLFPYQPVN